jgi:hypothetical protein
MKKLTPLVSVKLNKPQILVSSDLCQDIVKDLNYTPCTTLGQNETRSLKGRLASDQESLSYNIYIFCFFKIFFKNFLSDILKYTKL